MAKIMLSLRHKPEEYDVTIRIYNDEGILVEEKKYESIKQVVIRARETRISRQIAPSPIVLVVDLDEPQVELQGENILVIGGRACQ